MTKILQNPPLLLNESEAAHLLNCCAKTVYRMRQQGKIPFMRLGNAVRYPYAGLIEFIESQSSKEETPCERS